MNSNTLKRCLVVTGIVTSFLFLSAVNGYSDESWGQRGRGREGKFQGKWQKRAEDIHKQLNLTPEQDKQLKEHREKHRSAMKVLYQQIKAKREQIRAELQKPNFDINEVKRIHNELKSLQAQIDDYRLDGILEVRQILTPEQFAKFISLTERHKASGEEK